MISLRLILALIVGTIMMLIPIIIQMKWYKLKLWKSIPIAVTLTVVGTFSTYIWHYIESGDFNGISFFGAVFIVPIVFLGVSKLFRIKYGILMDLCAPAECIMLAIMKTQCLATGCCGGIELYTSVDGSIVRFPSQAVEFANALIIAIVLLLLSKQCKNRGRVYAWYMCLYGASRFVLNFFRLTSPIFFNVAYGSIWGFIAFSVGIILLIFSNKFKEDNVKKLCK